MIHIGGVAMSLAQGNESSMRPMKGLVWINEKSNVFLFGNEGGGGNFDLLSLFPS
jgi:hypothetical protein